MLRFDGRKDPERRAAAERMTDEMIVANGLVLYPRPFRKTTLTYATKIPVDFEVETLEGLHTGKAGDFLAIGVHGEMYPIDAGVMASSYEPVNREIPTDA